MRGGLGLVGLLVMCGIAAAFFAKIQYPTLKKGHEAMQQAESISGKSFIESVKVSPHVESGREWLDVTWVDPAGPAATYYGLAVNDRIVQFGDVSVTAVGAESAAGLLVDAYRSPLEKRPVTVVRGTQTLVLPLSGYAAPSGTGPATAPSGGNSNLPGGLQKIPLH